MRIAVASLLLLAALGAATRAATNAAGVSLSDDATRAFKDTVAPTLSSVCVHCHGPTRARGGMRADSRAALLSGGNRGPAFVSGEPDASRIVTALRHDDSELKMPPKKALPAAVVAAFEKWIRGGAPWPDGLVLEETVPTGDSAAGAMSAANADNSTLSDTWAFDPPKRRDPTEGAAQHFVRDPIDAFIAARLNAAGIAPAPEADHRTLIRRATLDVTGMPPTHEQVAAFVAESADDPDAAYVRLIDRLLASSGFGERCATDWLDVVRFAETQGFEMNQPRANAWPYRDWVIAAFNDDRPWPEFVRTQLAGDQFGEDAATGFLVAGAWDEVKSPDPELTAVQRDDELHGMVAVASAAFLGLTVGCAKCHDHKFDPITQHDYYSMRACFEGVRFGARPWRGGGGLAGTLPGRESVNARRNTERFDPIVARRVRFVANATNGGEPCLDEIEILSVGDPATDAGGTRGNVALASRGAIARASSIYEGDPKHALDHVNDGRYGNDRSWIAREASGWVEIELAAPTEIDGVVWGRDREGAYADRLPTDYRIEALVEDAGWRVIATSADRRPLRPDPQVDAGRFDPSPPATRLLERGNPMAPREPVVPSGLSAIEQPFHRAFSDTADASSTDYEPARRLALADWIGSPNNPLTARVIVNRIWQQHFGRGLVDTPSDFGAMGGRPSHLELLDQLALDLIEGGWRLKLIHRRILLSATYRQSSTPRADALAIDADARLLWRFPPRRLPAEAIRDSMLAAAGVLDTTMGGPGVSSFAPNDNYVRVYEPKSVFGPADFRRSIYVTRVRMHPDATFGVFDAPDGGQPCPRRAISTTPLQALTLIHSPLVHELAERFAQRAEREAAPDRQVERAFELALQRAPAADELAAARQLVQSRGLAACCKALLAASEFGAIE